MLEAKKFKTWIEINEDALRNNIGVFRRTITEKTKLMAVVKSNAYGHGIVVFSKLADELGIDGFCVDSVIEGRTLRLAGIKKPILVLGWTLPAIFEEAVKNDITITISNTESLEALSKSRYKPFFHLKIDTGMHRQGFYVEDMNHIFEKYKNECVLYCRGIYTHFASAGTLFSQKAFTDEQYKKFEEVINSAREYGITNIVRHMAATGGTIMDPRYHADWVRVGAGLYGFLSHPQLMPVLSWRTLISEIKEVRKGACVGYDLTEKINNPTKIAVLPIGYWHGMPRAFSSIGKVLVGGKEAKIIGRVSMDITVCDVGSIDCVVGDVATLIGKDGKSELRAGDLAEQIDSIHYELLTRLNPLMERIITH
ncbi:MAG: alanine racemase [Candidatus Harrisonbacteria bacterium RIFCSPLOWO2_01_FULL_40_28]|uniref:Alanine racemase n=1 Tax=Candidatus Harrisonbacteria bacterium RIFCSPLOWO2_01_FULL_40_28 TaxID=1798406 RepID=A0A1G1ZMN1_9BACT|nr:MAG: alanine racemase [Candidatus Harrisonbacteria bacterium RIFCSPLOWO2_01_FULL_40_28]